MTIRYSCKKCESVLKIRDELGGSDAKCPKCKTAFVIPKPKSEKALVGAGASKSAQNTPVGKVVSLDSLIDLPMEITPPVNPADTDLLDIARDAAATAASAKAKLGDAPKPSIADLMKEHEAAKKKKAGGKAQSENLAAAANVAAMVTSGSAADALTRNYDQKRGTASAPPPMTREEKRAVEQKEALKEFAVKAIPAIVGLVVLFAGFLWYMSQEALPDLGYPSGVVTQNGAPLAGVVVRFSPIGSGDDFEGGSSQAFTDATGAYTLMYNSENEGAVLGAHRVLIETIDGIQLQVPPQDQEQTVESGSSTINFNL